MNSAILQQAPDTTLVWPPKLFLTGDPNHAVCPAAIDLTGLNRILLYHPDATLPVGRWRAAIDFDVCADGATRPFRLEFGAAHSLAVTDHQPSRGGRQSMTAECALAASSAVELRLWVVRPTFHGELRFLGATVRQLDDASS